MNQIGESHQGVCVFALGQPHFEIKSAGENSVVLILDRIQDARNFGAVIRNSLVNGCGLYFFHHPPERCIKPFCNESGQRRSGVCSYCVKGQFISMCRGN